MKSRGLGDSIEKITRATGLKTLADFAAKAAGKEDCGCDKRKKALNNWFPYNNINNGRNK
tara:strand:+ start:1094 stop:1273 length:180 start_codon:yes stop_codon:yes gene_type:complete